jgi:Asp-tRNA(Asn)/Glu-tRNA(Gln) amidotransferase A subunit family amidase/biotin carboxylase
MDDSICDLSARSLATALHRREVRATEALEAVLKRANELAASLNPFSVRLDASAYAAAAAADVLLDRGEGGPLCGIPITIKDSHWLAGVEATTGSASRIGFVPAESTAAVERLIAAGAVIFAKTTVSEFAYSGITESTLFGRTNNPWDVTRTPGGSSGGAGAAVAAGLGPLALGGDGGGSIRIPAAFCGVVGHKPTFGLVPHEPSSAGWKTLVALGPMTRSIADARLMLAAIAGPDWRDRHSGVATAASLAVAPPEHWRFAASEDLGFAALDDDVRRIFRDVVTRLAATGIDVVHDGPVVGSSARTWCTIACAESRWSEGLEYERMAHLLSVDVLHTLIFGDRVTIGDYVLAQFDRERIHRAYADFFHRTGAHVLLTPTLGCEAFAHGKRYPSAIGGHAIEPPWLDWAPFLYDANLAGLPACAVPIGFGDDGLPVSIQVIGKRWDDGTVLNAAEAIESIVAFNRRPPPLTRDLATNNLACADKDDSVTLPIAAAPSVNRPPPQIPTKTSLRGVSEIRSFLRTNLTPVYFISPTPFNLLGMDRWVHNFFFISYYDCFDGHHPKVFVPSVLEDRAWQSMEEMNDYLLGHPEVKEFVNRRSAGKAIFVMFDAAAEALSAQLQLTIALPTAALRTRVDSKIMTTQMGNDAGVASVPNVLGYAASYDALSALAQTAGLGEDLVVQMAYGDSGRTTFFIKSAADWDAAAAAHPVNLEQIKVMRRIRERALAVEAVITRYGTLVGPIMADLCGHAELTPYKGGWCGNDLFPKVLTREQISSIRSLTQKFGERLKSEGYLGFFEVDYLVDLDTGAIYLGEMNPRLSGITSMTDVTAGAYADMPLFLFHLLEYMDVDFSIDVEEINTHFAHANAEVWSQAIMKQTDDEAGRIIDAPRTGIWTMDAHGQITYAREATDWTALDFEWEVFYLRIAGHGTYRYRGLDLGIFVSRARLQTDDGTSLTETCKRWTKHFKDQFITEPLPIPIPTAL